MLFIMIFQYLAVTDRFPSRAGSAALAAEFAEPARLVAVKFAVF
jgi:hypothetical protein